MTQVRIAKLETVFVVVPREAVDPYEAAMAPYCRTVGIFEAVEDGSYWRIEGVREIGDDSELRAGLMLAEMVSGVSAELGREETDSEGWLARVLAAFPEQSIGKRFVIRGTHLGREKVPGKILLSIDAGLAFGSGEHGSTRGCLRAFEKIAYLKPRQILDLGCGSGILAMGAAAVLHRPVLAVDIDPWSVRVTRENAQQNGLKNLIRPRLGMGLANRDVRAAQPFDLIFANILARPLCAMAREMADACAPGGRIILAGLLNTQANMVLAAYRRQGLVKAFSVREGSWTILVLHRR